MSEKEYIERVAALELFWENSGNWNLINAIPAADVEPVVRGEWDKTKDKEHDFRTYFCSVCGKGEYYFNATQYAYCPHCGAHMERSGSSE